jgi:hypothetical protein
MLTRSHRAGRPSVRLGLEALEGRMLLSAALPAPAPATAGQISGANTFIHGIEAASALHSATAVSNAYFNYFWSMTPSTVITGANPRTHTGISTGSVDFALVRPDYTGAPLGGAATGIRLGTITTLSSASDKVPDVYHSAFTLTLRIADAASGRSGTVSFKGLITGTLSASKSNLTITFQRSLSQKVTIGNHLYTVTVPSTLKPNGPHERPTMVYVSVQASTAHH